VVDDHDMAVTHVIRGDDHFTNAARQAQIYRALGWAVPQMAHIPLIHGPDGAKLSKRHGALGIEAYRDMGYLPAALRNYLVRLGWSHGDQEIFSTEEMIAAFDLGGIGRSPARLDLAKLENLNGIYLREANNEALVEALEGLLPHIGEPRGLGPRFSPELRAKFLAAMDGLKERAKTLIELLDSAYFLYAKVPLALDVKAAALLDEAARRRLAEMHVRLADVAEWSPTPLEAAVRAYAEESGVKLGQVAQPLRAALTGRTTSPGLFDVMAVLGRTECLARLEAQSAAADGAGHASMNLA
jgi:glutamyl-tRNA synthetase